ncbi:hypothetical protein GLOIN_2v905547 [Rhizophagus irregularis DAOM 181602=DAOM 197198]|uniref:Uncharacterized protein n=1 Tax=Rhizophagus irregularis (strain DAOM 181602 / DAOM 197198 / MUCL 43194) TaxID=747089 RepID=A0A2P4QF03_RHIID|nr:hypothetical protein GLOIN_2v905547 [Rhizophagus irregularis DAOM 181602=DAOM 197198]POG76209.1 hypothetical protein GLOIN_2v905547 [Rhizophagus irregularis DAOM 181602=DAOM 197198]GET53135.1 hypothetical protein GLOIN_2v905547 [Rhizophagus irregularis DAOM 181602=DAOM 197198]|eukprot:XP_025183075.1 hypothetical protein GLOIN_2v905547 [Rhizophagus irregularis DAOM 181602=DAOM 197198]
MTFIYLITTINISQIFPQLMVISSSVSMSLINLFSVCVNQFGILLLLLLTSYVILLQFFTLYFLLYLSQFH